MITHVSLPVYRYLYIETVERRPHFPSVGRQVQSSLDQLFTAMEALVRRRNQDVQLVNGYLRTLAIKGWDMGGCFITCGCREGRQQVLFQVENRYLARM